MPKTEVKRKVKQTPPSFVIANLGIRAKLGDEGSFYTLSFLVPHSFLLLVVTLAPELVLHTLLATNGPSKDRGTEGT